MQCALLDVGTTQRARCADISRSIDLPRQTGESGFAGALSAVGYDTAFIGKAHFATANTFAPTGSGECLKSSDPSQSTRGADLVLSAAGRLELQHVMR